MAADVVNGSLTPAVAKHTICLQYAAAHPPMPRLASFAFCASAHASTATSHAGHEDINVVVHTGYYCARALLSYEDANADEIAAIWDFAVRAIKTALELDPGVTARHGLTLSTPA